MMFFDVTDMKTYAKGAAFERELMHYLRYKGLAVVRQAGSGGETTPVDILALKQGMVLAIECKNHAEKPRLPAERVQRFTDWCRLAGAIGLLAWKKPGGNWLFLRLEDAAGGRYEDESWLELEQLLGAFLIR